MSDSPVPEKKGWFARLKAGLSRSAGGLTEGVSTILQRRKLDEDALEELEELLIKADLGIAPAAEVIERLRKSRFANRDVTADEVKGALAESAADLLRLAEKPLRLSDAKPHVVLVVGVNGTGKTTTIGKLAQRFRAEGKRVMLAAGDTFRAAAIEQLTIWGQRTGATVIAGQVGADAAGLAFDALQRARAEQADLLLIDTAGRLHNKAGLMAELAKIVRVLKKVDPAAPHSVLLVLDATTGQNAIQQVETFREICQVTGLVVTKLDGTARGGVLVAVAQKFGLPVHFVGVGESAEDLQVFNADAFARALAGLETAANV